MIGCLVDGCLSDHVPVPMVYNSVKNAGPGDAARGTRRWKLEL